MFLENKKDIRLKYLDYFFTKYNSIREKDLYAWIWEGEFGFNYINKLGSFNLRELLEEINHSQIKNSTLSDKTFNENNNQFTNLKNINLVTPSLEKSKYSNYKNLNIFKLYEPIGLSNLFLKLDLYTYQSTNCPFTTIIDIQNSAKDFVPQSLRFMRNWKFAKDWCVENKKFSKVSFEDFERQISVHLTPRLEYSTDFMFKYETIYRIIPQKIFLNKFPEYKIDWDKIKFL